MEPLREDAVIAALEKAGIAPVENLHKTYLRSFRDDPEHFERAFPALAALTRTLQEGCPPLRAPVDPVTRLWREYKAQINMPAFRQEIERGDWDTNCSLGDFRAAVKALNATIIIGDGGGE